MSGFLEQGITQGKAKKASNIKYIAGFYNDAMCDFLAEKHHS